MDVGSQGVVCVCVCVGGVFCVCFIVFVVLFLFCILFVLLFLKIFFGEGCQVLTEGGVIAMI